MKRISFFLILSLITLSSFSLAIAQTLKNTDGMLAPALVGGTVPSSLGLSSIEHANLYNGSLNVTIPLLQVGGRGESGYDMVLPIERHWSVAYLPSSNIHDVYSWTDPWYSELDEDSVTPYSPGQLIVRQGSQTPNACSINGVTEDLGPYVTRLVWVAPDGSESVLRDSAYDGQAQGADKTTCASLNGYTPVNRMRPANPS